MIGWKLFEEVQVNDVILPKSLVHGHINGDGTRTRTYVLDKSIYCEPGTPGFNYFGSYEDMIEYLPRFKIRKNRLVACEIELINKLKPNSGNYLLAWTIKIPKLAWVNRINGQTMLAKPKTAKSYSRLSKTGNAAVL